MRFSLKKSFPGFGPSAEQVRRSAGAELALFVSAPL